LEDLDAEVEINSAWETIRENIETSPKESLGYFEFNGLTKDARNCLIKGNKLNCSGYRVHLKEMGVIGTM
jgi:hypothetical protein